MRRPRTAEEQEIIMSRTFENTGVRAGAGLTLFGLGTAITGLVVGSEEMLVGGYLSGLTGIATITLCGISVVNNFDRESSN